MLHVKVDDCPGDDLQTFYLSCSRRIECVARSKLIQTNLTEPDVEPFLDLTLFFFDSTLGSSHETFDAWPRPKTTFNLDYTKN